jgi:hypothetical protein
MQAIGVIALTMTDVNLFPKPPRRPAGSIRRPRSSRSARLTRAVGRFIVSAVQDDQARNPRLGSYPY